MTYQDWRQFGWVSPLSQVLVCKGPGGNINTGNAITGQQLNAASTASSNAANDYSQFKSLISPLITQQSDLASGNRQQALAAAMPVISQLSGGFSGAKQNILNNMAPGAARDRALTDLGTQMYTTIGGAQAGAAQNAPTILANLGNTVGNMSMQELAAALNALQGGSTTNYNTGQMAAQQQQAMLNFFGGLAQTAGGMISPIKICWIAEAIYGERDYRTAAARWWLNGPFKATWRGRCVMALYQRFGIQVAGWVRRSTLLRTFFKPLFDKAVACAFRDWPNAA